MRILGVDPGTRRTGVGIIDARGNHYELAHFEVISVKESLPVPERLHLIYQALLKIISQYRPDIVALENIFFGKDLRAMVKIGEARACAFLAASEHGVNVVEYAPARIKQSVAGNGRATKEQVQHMIKTLLNLKTLPPSDGADALAVALCHLHSHKTTDLKLKTKDLNLNRRAAVAGPGSLVK